MTAETVVQARRLPAGRKRYVSVNGTWPDKLPPLEPEEAISAAKRLYRLAMGKAFKGRFRLTSGNRYTWVRQGVFQVNPDKGWHSLVHDISHLAHQRLYPRHKPHDWRHATIERKLVEAVVSKGWLDGKLRRPSRPKPDIRVIRYQRLLSRVRTWERKRKRAETALKKLSKQTAYYAKTGILPEEAQTG